MTGRCAEGAKISGPYAGERGPPLITQFHIANPYPSFLFVRAVVRPPRSKERGRSGKPESADLSG